MQTDIPASKKRVEAAEEKSINLHVEVLKLEDKYSLLEVKSTELEKALNDVRGELASQKSFFERRIKSLQSQVTNIQGQVKVLGKKADNGYNSGLAFCYKCIMTILGMQYLKLKIDRLVALVIEYM